MSLKLRISIKEKVIGVPEKPQTVKAMFTVEHPITVELVDDDSEVVIKSAE